MKFSQETISILKSFSNINTSMGFKKGNELRVIANSSSVIGIAQIEETIPKDLDFYQGLSKILGTISIFGNDVNIEFEDSHINIIKEGTKKNVKIFKSGPEVIIDAYLDIDYPTNELAKFDLKQEEFTEILKLANTLQLPNVVIQSKEGKVSVIVVDTDVPDENKYSFEVGESNRDFYVPMLIEDISKLCNTGYTYHLLANDDYSIVFSKFVSNDEKITYWVAVEEEKLVLK